MPKWTDAHVKPADVHMNRTLAPGVKAAILSAHDGQDYFLDITVDSSQFHAATLAECQRDIVQLLLPALEEKVAQLRAIVRAEEVEAEDNAADYKPEQLLEQRDG